MNQTKVHVRATRETKFTVPRTSPCTRVQHAMQRWKFHEKNPWIRILNPIESDPNRINANGFLQPVDCVMVDPDEEVRKFQYSIRVAQGGGGPSSAMRRMKDPMGSMWRWWHANDRKAGGSDTAWDFRHFYHADGSHTALPGYLLAVGAAGLLFALLLCAAVPRVAAAVLRADRQCAADSAKES